MTKMENKSNILQRLNAESNDNYEKVASRMRLAMKIADAIEASGMTKKSLRHDWESIRRRLASG